MYKGMTLFIFCMNGLNHMCQWEASCIWWSFFEDVVLKILKCWCVYHQVYNVSSRLWTWNFTKPFQNMVNGSLKMYYKAPPPHTLFNNCQICVICIHNVPHINIADDWTHPSVWAYEILWNWVVILVCFCLFSYFISLEEKGMYFVSVYYCNAKWKNPQGWNTTHSGTPLDSLDLLKQGFEVNNLSKKYYSCTS